MGRIDALTYELLETLMPYSPEELVDIWNEWQRELGEKKASPRVEKYCRGLVEYVIYSKL